VKKCQKSWRKVVAKRLGASIGPEAAGFVAQTCQAEVAIDCERREKPLMPPHFTPDYEHVQRPEAQKQTQREWGNVRCPRRQDI